MLSCCRLGYYVGCYPIPVLIGCLVFTVIMGIGVYRFEEETNPQKLFVPQDSVAVSDQDWVNSKFPGLSRFQSVIITGQNVLTPEVLKDVSLSFSLSLFIFTICERKQ